MQPAQNVQSSIANLPDIIKYLAISSMYIMTGALAYLLSLS